MQLNIDSINDSKKRSKFQQEYEEAYRKGLARGAMFRIIMHAMHQELWINGFIKQIVKDNNLAPLIKRLGLEDAFYFKGSTLEIDLHQMIVKNLHLEIWKINKITIFQWKT
jgi:hypothetical protein